MSICKEQRNCPQSSPRLTVFGLFAAATLAIVPSLAIAGSVRANEASVAGQDSPAFLTPTDGAYAVALTTSLDPAQVDQAVDLVAMSDAGIAGNSFTFYDVTDSALGTPLCSDVTASTVGPQWIAHCSVMFPAPGERSLFATVGTGPDIVLPSNPITQTIVPSVAFDADQFALTGSWYNPTTPGQGVVLEVYRDLNLDGSGALFGGWFTYDATGHQRWMTLQGNLSAIHGSSYSLGIYVSTGGYFNAPPITGAIADGSATLTFHDCTHASLSYEFPDGQTGLMPLVRLSNATGCSTAVPATVPGPLPTNYNDVLHSGAWYNPSTAGQGLVVDIIPSQTTLFAAWFTYAPQSQGLSGVDGERWFTLQTNNYTPGDLTIDNVPIYSSAGGVFGDPAPVTAQSVGTANIAFPSCTTMTIDYTFTAGEFAGLSGSVTEQNLAVSGCQ